MVFVNSMSDLWHPLVPADFIDRVFAVMQEADRHTYQILTKRPELMKAWFEGPGARWAVEPLPNVWLGTSIENDRWVHRADALRGTPAAVKFISAEPLLGPLPSLNLVGIDWLIVGGESGSSHRPMDEEWVRALKGMAEDAGTAFFFKQWGGRTPKAGGRHLDGRTWDEYPAAQPEGVARS
jgi:protein gp37